MLSYPINVHTFENKIRKIEPFFKYAELHLFNSDYFREVTLAVRKCYQVQKAKKGQKPP